MRFTVSLFALALALSPSLAAQHVSSPRFYVAGGFELTPLSGDGLGLSAQAGYFRQLSRLGLRAGVAYFERHRQDFGPLNGYNGTIAATFDITYDLTRSATRPYLIGGVSAYRSFGWWRFEGSDRVDFARFGVAPVLGAGLRFPLGTAEVFTELRIHVGKSVNTTRVLWPLTFGIRF